MKLLTIALAVAVLTLSGCATQDYQMYADAQKSVANARAMSEAARYAALAEIAKSGDTAAKVAAVMTLQQGGGGGQAQHQQMLNPPKSFGETALQWTSVLLPTLTQFYGINANRQVAITQSNNQAAIATSTNNTFASMNGNMAKSNTDIANAGFTAVTTVANNGLTAVTTTAANGLNAATSINANSNATITAISNASNASVQAISSQLSQIQPNVTTTNTTNTTNNCGANTTGGTLTCP